MVARIRELGSEPGTASENEVRAFLDGGDQEMGGGDPHLRRQGGLIQAAAALDSLRPDAGAGDHVTPFLDVVADAGAERLRRAGIDLDTLLVERVAHLGVAAGPHHLAVEPRR